MTRRPRTPAASPPAPKPMPKPGTTLAETALYAPVKAFLAARGYVVKGEIRGCDVVAVRDGAPTRLVIAELKLGFSLELLLQGIDRMPMADEVWLATRARRQSRRRQSGVVRLCRLLGFGLLSVTASGTVTTLAEPEPYRPRPDPKRRRLLLREHAARTGDPATGGSTRQPLMTAYRQNALRCAAALAPASLTLAELRIAGLDPGTIPARNVYGWFRRESRGRYALTDAGRLALRALAPDDPAPA
ncbi:MAG: DUF2161 family putative PD-(D/E)XK-type phosphodiesterase [Janthinobacterium lividum]